ncbi:MAG: phosphoribosylamine--glycine ligase, partial [Clostridia bacterium]|nr:phosphoribosylamine--glycine ligase [Clostridia bacterium]
MRVLVVGSGGREHAIVHKLSKSSRVDEIFCTPGNGGISDIAECVPIKATDLAGVRQFAIEKCVDLVFVASDDPLALGMVDMFKKEGVRVFGPTRDASIIESSKVFSKNLMKKHGIPTASYETFDNPEEAIRHIMET